MNPTEIIKDATQAKQDKQFTTVVQLLEPLWKVKKTVDIAYLLAFSYRHLGQYDLCNYICDEADKHLNKPMKLKAQRQWCYVFEKIRDIGRNNITLAEQNAEDLLKTLNQSNKYDLF